jgi:hypothetical protein
MKKSDLHRIIKEEISKIINESPSTLIANKKIIADKVLDSNLEDKDRIANFIIRSAPSEVYLQKIIDMLGINITDFSIPTPQRSKRKSNNNGVNPREFGGGPSKNPFNPGYTGD